MDDNPASDFLAECEAKANEAKGMAAKAAGGLSIHGTQIVDYDGYRVADVRDDENRDFFAHARTSNPDLAERVLQLVAMVRKLQEQVDDMEDRAREEAYYRDYERD